MPSQPSLLFPPPAFADLDRRRKLAAGFPGVAHVFQDFMEQKQIPGLAYGIVIDGELAHAGGFGVRDIDAQAPVDADTVFRIASMTKSLTAMAVVKLRDEGQLRLDDPAAQYVPELAGLVYPTRDSAAITVRNLLTMSAGFPEDNAWGDRQLAVSEEQVTQWLAAGIPFSSPPGVVFEYSNFAYAILGRVVANVAAVRCQDYVSKHILAPLGMTNTYWHAAEAPADRLALGYTREGDDWVAEPLLGDGAFAAMAGLFTSIGDFSRYAALLLSAWPPRDDAESGPICRSSLREMQQTWRHEILLANQVTADGQPCPSTHGYGYGLATTVNCRFNHVVAHGGGLPGFGSLIHLLPEYGVGILAFANLTYAGPRTAVAAALDVLEQTGGLQPRVLQPTPALVATRDAIVDLYAAWDDDAAGALVADNFFLDASCKRRRPEMEQLRAEYGACLSVGSFQATNALRGRWRMECEHGAIDGFIALAPTMPPRLQSLTLTPCVY